MKKDILYFNTLEDIKIVDMLRTTSKEKELPNQIILTIQSAGAGEITPIFSKDALGSTVFASINEIGTKFILDDKEVTSDDFQVVTKSQYGIDYNFFGLQFEDSNEHVLKISLINSKIPNFQRINSGPGCKANSITSVVISNSITEIGESAFKDCTNLTSIIIPNSVTTIGDYAFSDCSGLTSVEIPNSVTTIGDWAFERCTGLTSVTIPNSVTSISSHTFDGCSGLTSVTIPNSVTTIGAFSFAGCTGLTSVTIPNSVTSIGESAFSGCSSLRSITSLAVTAPTISSNTFQDVKTNGVLIIPLDSDYSAWISTGDYYLGKYNWQILQEH